MNFSDRSHTTAAPCVFTGVFLNLVLPFSSSFMVTISAMDWPLLAWLFFPTNSTTKMAPHLDGYVWMWCFIVLLSWQTSSLLILSFSRVHVVFGLVISGFEVIKKIEGLKTDSASRPYADARVVDCGQLITKSANDSKLPSPTDIVSFLSKHQITNHNW